jgi:hypothetical protein
MRNSGRNWESQLVLLPEMSSMLEGYGDGLVSTQAWGAADEDAEADG